MGIGINNWALLILLSLIWGASFFLIDKSLMGFTPMQLGALRIFISFIALSPFLFTHIKKIPKDKWGYVFLTGLFGSGIPPFLFALAQTKVDSGVAGILNSLTPVFTLAFGIIFFQMKAKIWKAIGIGIGFLGALTVLYNQTGESESAATYGVLIILATMCYAISVNIVKHHLQDYNTLAITSLAFFMIGIPAAGYLYWDNTFELIQNNKLAQESLMYLAILAVFGTAMASALFFKLVQNTNALFSSMVTYLIPIVAIIFGKYNSEEITSMTIIGMLLILLGVYLAGRKKD